MTHLSRALLLALALAAGCGGSRSERAGPPAAPSLTVMTRNVYHGGQFDRIQAAAPTGVPFAVDAMWEGMQATDPPSRMRALADEIAALRPDLVALQEVALWRSQRPGDGPRTAATTVEHDLLALLLDALRARGAAYLAVATFTGVDVELTGASGDDYRFTDRDVVLARAGVATSNPREGAYRAAIPAPVPVPGGGVAPGVRRGWASVEVRLGDRSVRFVDTHLETSAAVNAAQAAELVAAIGVDLPVVVAGDLNSAPGERAHGVLVSAATGLRDAWAEAGSGPGPTCCHDAAVRDPAALPARRIDLVLVRGPIVVRSATVAGADPSAMRDGRWPSDHAGVAATLTLE